MLNHKVEIYVPMNNPEQEQMRDAVFQMFCEEFGGATINPVLGGWIGGEGNLVTDKIGIVYSYVSVITPVVSKLLKKIAIEVREQLNQDAVTLVIDGKAGFY